MFCPYCENRILLTKFNDLATKRPDLLKFYDYDKNELPPEQMLISSYDPDTWWICDERHSFQRSVARMCETTSCLVCDRKLVVPGVNDAEFAYPKIVSVWDYDKTNVFLVKFQIEIRTNIGTNVNTDIPMKHTWSQ